MDNKFNLKGNSFGRLTVIENDRMEKGVRWALCLCDCGKEVDGVKVYPSVIKEAK